MGQESSALSGDALQIKKMFSSIASRYDRANSILSLGIHHLWRRKLVSYSEVKRGQSVLDCATGTGDLALEFKRFVGSSGSVVGTDFCQEMVDHAPLKAFEQGLDVKFEIADVTRLPFADQSFDVSSIAFGIRNVPDKEKGLSELYRVTKSGGHVMVLEFGQPKNPAIQALYSFYSSRVLPQLGGWITGRKQAYEYLEKSSAKFPCRENFVDLMKSSAPFKDVQFISLSFGVAYIYKGRV